MGAWGTPPSDQGLGLLSIKWKMTILDLYIDERWKTSVLDYNKV